MITIKLSHEDFNNPVINNELKKLANNILLKNPLWKVDDIIWTSEAENKLFQIDCEDVVLACIVAEKVGEILKSVKNEKGKMMKIIKDHDLNREEIESMIKNDDKSLLALTFRYDEKRTIKCTYLNAKEALAFMDNQSEKWDFPWHKVCINVIENIDSANQRELYEIPHRIYETHDSLISIKSIFAHSYCTKIFAQVRSGELIDEIIILKIDDENKEISEKYKVGDHYLVEFIWAKSNINETGCESQTFCEIGEKL